MHEITKYQILLTFPWYFSHLIFRTARLLRVSVNPYDPSYTGEAVGACQSLGNKLDQLISCDSHGGIVLTGKT